MTYGPCAIYCMYPGIKPSGRSKRKYFWVAIISSISLFENLVFDLNSDLI